MSFRLNVYYDQETLARLAQLENYGELLTLHIMNSLGRSADAVRGEAEVYMWATFINPQGTMEDSLHWEYLSPTRVAITTDIPYAQRLHFGFSNKTDALGRYYPYWPAYHWADHAIENAELQVHAIFLAEMEAASCGIR